MKFLLLAAIAQLAMCPAVADDSRVAAAVAAANVRQRNHEKPPPSKQAQLSAREPAERKRVAASLPELERQAIDESRELSVVFGDMPHTGLYWHEQDTLANRRLWKIEGSQPCVVICRPKNGELLIVERRYQSRTPQGQPGLTVPVPPFRKTGMRTIGTGRSC